MKAIVKRSVAIFCVWAAFLFLQGTAIGAEINIGVVGVLTGPSAYFGLDGLHGAEIAVKELNDAGGVNVGGTKYTVMLRTYDDEGNAAKAVAGMQRLKDKYNCPVILQNSSACILGMMEKNEKMNVLLSGYFRHPEATNKGNKLLLRHHIPTREDATSLANGVVKIFNAKTVALLSDVSDYGKGYVAAYTKLFNDLGVKIVANEWLDQRTQTDFRSQLTKIKAEKPDVIMLSAYDEASAGAVKQANELGIKTPIALTTGFQQMGEKLTGPDIIEGYIKPAEYNDITPLPPAVERYKTKLYPAMKYKEPMGLYGQIVYQNVHTIILAMQKAGSTTDPWKIRAAAPLVVPVDKKYNTTGFKAWKENGEGVMEQRLGQYKNGKLVVVLDYKK